MNNSLNTTGLKTENFSIKENNNNSIISNKDTEGSGFFLIPSQEVPGRQQDITGYIITSATHDGKLEWTSGDQFGNVYGPIFSTNNAIARWDSTTGKILKNTSVTIDDTNSMLVPGSIKTNTKIILTENLNNSITLQSGSPINSYNIILPVDIGAPGQILKTDGIGQLYWDTGSSGGGGDVLGDLNSTNNAIARFNGVSGKAIQNSFVIIDDFGTMTGILDLTASGTVVSDNVNINSNLNLINSLTNNIVTIKTSDNLLSDYSITIPNTQGQSSSILLNDGSGNLSWSTTIPTGLPQNINGTIQYNNGGFFGGDSNLLWNSTEKEHSIIGKSIVGSSVKSINPSLQGSHLEVQAQTLIDPTGGPTTSSAVFTSFAQPILSAISPKVTENASTVYIENSPLPSTNQTIINNYALWVNSGNVKVNDNFFSDSTVQAATFTDGICSLNQGNFTGILKMSLGNNRTVFVNSESDFPISIGGYHILESDTNYIVTSQISMIEGIQFGSNTSITGAGFSSTLSFPSTLTAFKSINQNVFISNINIFGGGDNIIGLCDFKDINYGDSPPFYGRSKRIFINCVNFFGVYKFGIVDGFETININYCFMNGQQTITEKGFVISNSLSLEFNNNKIISWKGSTTTNTEAQLTLANNDTYNPLGKNIGMNVVSINNNIFHPRDSERGLLIEKDFTVQFGTISGNTFIRLGGIAALIDYPRQATFDNYNPLCISNFIVESNNGIRNNSTVSNALFNGNTSITQINTIGVPELIDPPTNTIKGLPINTNLAINLTMTNTTPFVVGEIITGSISGTQALVVDVVSDTEYYIIDSTGSFDNSDIITGDIAGTGSFSSVGDGVHFKFKYLGINPRKLQFSFSTLLSQESGNNKDWEISFRINGSIISPIVGRVFVTQRTRPGTVNIVALDNANKGDYIDFLVSNLTDTSNCIVQLANFTVQ